MPKYDHPKSRWRSPMKGLRSARTSSICTCNSLNSHYINTERRMQLTSRRDPILCDRLRCSNTRSPQPQQSGAIFLLLMYLFVTSIINYVRQSWCLLYSIQIVQHATELRIHTYCHWFIFPSLFISHFPFFFCRFHWWWTTNLT